MAISIQTNIPSLSAQRALRDSDEKVGSSTEKLATGRRINHAGDDNAGMVISQRLEKDIRGAEFARRNATDARSLMQVAEGGMNSVSNAVLRLRELATQAASDSVGDEERSMLNAEAQQLTLEVDRIAQATRFGSAQLLNGNTSELNFQIGTSGDDSDRVTFDGTKIDVRSGSLGIDGLDLSSSDSARDSIDSLDKALTNINMGRAQLGGTQERLDMADEQLSHYADNLSEAKSKISDTDYGKESAELVKAQIQQRAGIAVLAQANTMPSHALRLLEG